MIRRLYRSVDFVSLFSGVLLGAILFATFLINGVFQ